MGLEPTQKEILVVCTANLCRSPMVTGILNARLTVQGLDQQVRVSSAGLYAAVGEPASAESVALLAEQGIDIGAHRAQQVDERRLHQADLILVMEERHRQQIFYYAPEVLHKVILLSELVHEHVDLKDPYNQPRSVYQATLARITDLLERGWDQLLERLNLVRPR